MDQKNIDQTLAFLELSNFSEARIAVLGDFGLDEYVFGHVDRISFEAPVPILNYDRREQKLGCAANVIANLAALAQQLPIKATAFGVMGEDNTADIILNKMNAFDSVDTHILKSKNKVTPHKTRFIAGSQHQLLRFDHENTNSIEPELEKKLLAHVEKNISNFNVLVVQDYAKGVLTPTLLKKVLKLAADNDVLSVVDPHRNTPIENYKGASYITPNVDEAQALFKKDFNKGKSDQEIQKILAELMQNDFGISNILLTRSQYGMSVIDNKLSVRHFPASAKEVFDVSGAGDTVVAVLALSLALGSSIEVACAMATAASSVVVAKVGTSTADVSEIVQYLKTH